MPLIDLPTLWTVLLDIAAWFVIHMGASYLGTRLPLAAFDGDGWLYRMRQWEERGALYQRLFRVRRWKAWLPSGGAWFRGGFSMRAVGSHRYEYLERFLRETRRAELVHWLTLACAPLFFLWNPALVGAGMLLYGLAANLPCIIVQRANRPAFRRLLARAERQARVGIGGYGHGDEPRR